MSSSAESGDVKVSISDAFDGGNIEFVEQKGNQVFLKIKPDLYTELEKTNHFQYFAFRSLPSLGGHKEEIEYVIQNAKDASYAGAWNGSTVCYSKALSSGWKRLLNTNYEDGCLKFSATGSGYFAYFPPYSYQRHLEFLSKIGEEHIFSLGKTLQGRDIDCVKIGSGKSICWLIHRQHPGESMAEYYAEGVLTRLLGLETEGSIDGVARECLQKYTFYIVPNMCLDGSVMGHLRTNAAGANLNREWHPSEGYDAPTLERSPEVYHVLKKMDETGVDAFLDVHGDEALPFNFLAGSEGCPKWEGRLKKLHGAFLASYCRANPDMNKNIGYEPEAPNEGRKNICSNQIAMRFDCFSATLEMPFKDCYNQPDPERGWTMWRSKQLGASVLDPLKYVHAHLRDEASWENFGEEDAYIRPTEKYE
eukprot:CAMPEP_0202463696 /NCGR_PEP_ID=MMETSP1360-20130828/59169_1 /ASSEMBLY_ACC=CAM_ASM_000848 /TAXON_ID=515479 /ORGANISM="Licmophora paradoxa, Strain CCMP2313" /LENGTH=419 /DNA_ID=CAMNT_0049086699 /DNA_START=94 /DNA_END=1353 /DNA_ORIENTATION=-